MSIIASCGHELPYNSLGTPISIRDWDETGSPSVIYLTACDKCKNLYALKNDILLTSQDEDEWLND